MLPHVALSVEPGSALCVVGGAVLYAAGVRRAWQRAGIGRGVSRGQVCWFAAGLLTVAVALLSSLDAMADELFSAHMTQHVLLTALAPPLLVLGAPEVALVWLLAPVWRRRVVRRARESRWLSAAWLAISAPIVACTLHFLAVWGWHEPRLYELALRNDVVHAAEHLSFLATGLLLWWRVVHPHGVSRRHAYGVGFLTLFLTATQEGLLGALFTISHRLIYPAQAGGAMAHGLTPLEDQQLAGLIMWIPGGTVYLVGMSVLFMRWFETAGPSASAAPDGRVVPPDGNEPSPFHRRSNAVAVGVTGPSAECDSCR